MNSSPNVSKSEQNRGYRKGRWSSLFNARVGVGVVLLVALLLVAFAPDTANSHTIPTFSVVSVVQDQTVTIQTYNFPAYQDFAVTMGPMGSLGIDGYLIGYTNSQAGGAFTATYAIPEALKGSYQIAIRLQSKQGYYAYNWFYNNTATVGAPAPATAGKGAAVPAANAVATNAVAKSANAYYTGIPTISISNINPNNTVTIQTNNFPANEEFTIRMGEMYTRGVNGYFVKTFNSGTGGSFTLENVPIPPELNGRYQISVRTETEHYKPPYYNPYYSYNWFVNDVNGAGGKPVIEQPIYNPAYTGVPTFMVCDVNRNANITIRTYNLPPNETFNVSMGYMGSLGAGYPTGQQINSNDGNTFTLNVPPELANLYQISVRFDGVTWPHYYAYNWFYNTTASVCN